jgi:hypothetical protein
MCPVWCDPRGPGRNAAIAAARELGAIEMSNTRRCWRRLLAGCLALSAVLGARGPAQVARQANQYADAVRELGSYCVGKVCLGLAPADVQRLGQHQWRTPPPDSDAPRCDATHRAQWRHAELTLRDGRRLQLGYDIVSGAAARRRRATGSYSSS